MVPLEPTGKCDNSYYSKENNWYNLYIWNKWANLGNFDYSINLRESLSIPIYQGLLYFE